MSDPARIDDYEEKKLYTYKDYLKWDTRERFQLINGEVYSMASPSVIHQAIQVELLTEFNNYLRGKPCRVFGSPLDVRLFPKKDRSDNTVVQPDLLVVCDKNKIDKGSINGAPDLVVEIISPSNTFNELFLKYQLYLKAGVKEFWTIDIEKKLANINIYDNGYYNYTNYEKDDVVTVTIFNDLKISMKDLWASLPE